ncbi:hypothetical protein [Roseicyclus persicicus]|uniref:Uncharacterized protein n=1 Tax=Roseicyclus persicicus TaxID=2650661 RepID=A0A7X6H0Q3_9RHOB|nr:hypothetical protein [Roseibacterium persicicum]NKX45887.1 hypothetical protein [Roseibacterium persicicum]
MDRIILIFAITLGVYAALAGLTWTQRLVGERRTGRKRGMVLNLARRAGPPMMGGAILLTAGAVMDLPGAAPLAAVVIAGGLAYGLHRGLAEVGQGDRRSLGFRLAVTLGLTLAILWQAGLA